MLLALTAAASLANSPPAPAAAETSAIVVEGRGQRKRAIHDFITAVTPSHVVGQLSRYESAACPAAVGLSDAQNRLVIDRLRQVAAAATVPVAHEPCAPNALVIVVGDKQRFIAELRKHYPAYFKDVIYGALPVPDERGPATAWHVTGAMSADHVAVSLHTPAKDGKSGTYFVSSSTDSSRLLPPRIPSFVAGVMVVEARSLVGLTTTQLADYAAMRLYARTDPRKLKPTASTVLGILDAPMGTAVPLTMTSWDLAFLKGLYRSDDRQYANRQRGEIEHSVDKATLEPSSDQ